MENFMVGVGIRLLTLIWFISPNWFLFHHIIIKMFASLIINAYGVSCHEIKTFCLHSLDRLVLVTMWTIVLLYKLDFHMSRQLLFPYLWWIYMFMTSMTTIFLQVCLSQPSLTFTSLGFHLQKVVHISCGWRHTLAFTERHNVFSWGRGTNGQLGHGESIDR